jgi:LacI family transcriptional regulator
MTIKKVAEKAGVGVSTVSRVLNRPDIVKEETREKVYSAMKAVGYSPVKKSAQHAYIIGLAVPNTKIDIMGELIRSIEDELMDTPYDLLILNMRMERAISRFFRETMNLTKKIDALIISSATIDDESVEYFRSLDIPVVLLQSRCSQEKSISTNNYQGALDAVNFMITRGYKKIGFIGWEPEDDHLVDRFHGYKNGIEKATLGFQSDMTAFGSLSVEGGYEATASLFEHAAPDGIFYACDSMAYGGYRYFLEKEIRIPADIGIIGFDDLEFSSVLGLTTMKQYLQNKVKIAVSYLLDRLSGNIETPSNEEISITPKLVFRNSTK